MDIDRDVALEILQRLQFDLSRVNINRDKFLLSCIEHTDRKPSCSINLEKGWYHCFSCGKKGTLTGLYYEHFGRSIYADLGIRREAKDNFSSAFQKIMQEAVDYDLVPDNFIKFEGDAVKAWDSPVCRKFLEGRGFTKAVTEQMNLWYALEGKVVDQLNDDQTDNFVVYKNRLMIPIREGGNTLSIEGRDIFGKDAFKGDPASYKKCLYPKGSSTSTLFQYDKLDKTKTVYFMESLMSLGAVRSCAHFKNSTSVFGASIATRQVFLLLKFPKRVFFIDNDLAGWRSLYQLGQAMERMQPGSTKDLYYVVPPRGAKDTGEIFEKLHMTIQECYDLHGFDREMPYDPKKLKGIVDRLDAIDKERKRRENLASKAKEDKGKEKANEQPAH